MSTRLLYNTWLYSIPKKKTNKLKKKSKRKNRKEFNSRIQSYADKLNTNLPQSEVWFQALFKETNIYKQLQFHFNKPKGRYIIDALSYKPKIAIEIDGSFHNSEEQKFKDRIKDKYLKKHGFKVYRIIAYNMNSYNVAIDEMIKFNNII